MESSDTPTLSRPCFILINAHSCSEIGSEEEPHPVALELHKILPSSVLCSEDTSLDVYAESRRNTAWIWTNTLSDTDESFARWNDAYEMILDAAASFELPLFNMILCGPQCGYCSVEQACHEAHLDQRRHWNPVWNRHYYSDRIDFVVDGDRLTYEEMAQKIATNVIDLVNHNDEIGRYDKYEDCMKYALDIEDDEEEEGDAADRVETPDNDDKTVYFDSIDNVDDEMSLEKSQHSKMESCETAPLPWSCSILINAHPEHTSWWSLFKGWSSDEDKLGNASAVTALASKLQNFLPSSVARADDVVRGMIGLMWSSGASRPSWNSALIISRGFCLPESDLDVDENKQKANYKATVEFLRDFSREAEPLFNVSLRCKRCSTERLSLRRFTDENLTSWMEAEYPDDHDDEDHYHRQVRSDRHWKEHYYSDLELDVEDLRQEEMAEEIAAHARDFLNHNESVYKKDQKDSVDCFIKRCNKKEEEEARRRKEFKDQYLANQCVRRSQMTAMETKLMASQSKMMEDLESKVMTAVDSMLSALESRVLALEKQTVEDQVWCQL